MKLPPPSEPHYVDRGGFSVWQARTITTFCIIMALVVACVFFGPRSNTKSQETPTIVPDQTCLTIKSNRDLGHQYSGVAFNVCIPDDQVRHLHDVWWDQHNVWVNK